MKNLSLTMASLVCIAVGSASVHAAVSYWDSNGATPGAGDTPNGIWDTDSFWSADPAGSSATTAYTPNNVAVFCAGNDATNAYTVTLTSEVVSSGLNFKNGLPTVTGADIAMSTAGQFPITNSVETVMSTALADFGATCGIAKYGTGRLLLSGANGFGGALLSNTVVEGILAAGAQSALGNTAMPTVVSNGATLEIQAATTFNQPVVLYGMGYTNSGALRGTASSPPNNAWVTGADCYSNAKITWDGTGTWQWSGSGASTSGPGLSVCTTNSGANYDVTIDVPQLGRTIRFNIGGRWATTGTGKIIKEGLGRVQFETPAYGTGGFDLNRGEVFPRNFGFNSGNIRVAASDYTAFVTTPNNNPSVAPAIALATGAHLRFILNKNNSTSVPLNFTCTGIISGQGQISVTNFGNLILNAANTYSGNTTVCGNDSAANGAGILTLGASASIANSPVIDVQTNALLEVTAVTGGFTVGTSQTLKGDGTVNGNVTVNGTLAPGAAIGTLTFNNDLTLGASANVAVTIDKANTPTSDLISVTGNLNNTGGGTLTVVNVGAALATNDTFQIFNKAVANGAALTVTGGGATWANQLATDGTIKVTGLATKVAATNLTITASGANSFTLGGMGGAGLTYNIYAYTNVGAPLATWWLLGTANANGSGVISYVDTQATNNQRYYRFGQ